MALFINGVGQDSFSMNGVSVDNLYVDGVLVWSLAVITEDPPIYLMTESLVNDGSFDYLFNSALSGSQFDAKLLTSGDTAWNPTAQEYPEDGTIDLSGGNKADTGWVAPQDTEWTMSGIYNVVMGVSYDMYSIHYKGNQTCDIYLGSNAVPIAISETDKPYTPPTGNWIIEEDPPAIIVPEPTDDSIVHFTFDDTLIDSKGLATITQHTGYEYVAGVNNNAISMTTTLGKLVLDYTPPLAYSIDLYMKTTSDHTGFLYQKGSNSHAIWVQEGYLVGAGRSNVASSTSRSASTLTAGTWYHIKVDFDGETAPLITIDDVEQALQAYTDYWGTNDALTMVASSSDSANTRYAFQGAVDDFKIFLP